MSSPGHEDHHAGDESSIALHCLRRGWRRRRLGDELFLFDEQTEYLARVDDLAVRRLAQAGTASTLREALAAAVDGTEADGAEVGPKPLIRDEDVVALRLLGVRMDVRCLHRRCGEQIRSYFSASAAELETASPEVVVWCEWEAADRHIYRSRPAELEGVPLGGVFVQTLRSGRRRWTSVLPPVPALASWPFKDRFIALHAAAIRTSRGDGVILAGDRGSGKTTTVLALARMLPGVEVLCDETAFIHCRTAVLEPFPHAVGVWRDGQKVQVPITALCDQIAGGPVEARRIVFLERGHGGPDEVERLSPSRTLRLLLPHHRDAGASLGDSTQTLLDLADRLDAWIVRCSDLTRLTELVRPYCL
jgi:hypothetical protein